MTTQIRPREWETLSAYLDGELNTKERERFEARLKEDQDLSRALSELRGYQRHVRSQPELRAPRNFTLTPEMAGFRAGQRMPSKAYPLMRLGAALAAAFLILITAGNLIAGRMQPALVLQSDLVQQTGIGMGGGGGGGGGVEEPVQSELVEKALEPTDVEAAPVAEMEVVEATPLAEATQSMLAAPELLEPPAAEDAGEAEISEAETSIEEGLQPSAETSVGVRILGVLQIALAVLAAGMGITAFFLRRSGQ